MDKFPEGVSVAIDLAARDIARVASEHFGSEHYPRILKNVSAMVKAAVSGSAQDAGGWVSPGPGWSRDAAPESPGLVDREKLQDSASRWWETLDDSGRIAAIMGPAGHHKSEYINNIVQKYEGKPESVLSKEMPGLSNVYEAGSAPAAPEKPAPAAETQEAVTEW
jgi:hypothetical protein